MAGAAASNRHILQTALGILNASCLQPQPPTPADEAYLRQIAADQATPIDELACLIIRSELRRRRMPSPLRLPVLDLTAREKEVLVLITQGLSSKQVARQLGITFKTAVCHRSRMMAKLGVHETASLVRYALRERLISGVKGWQVLADSVW